MMPSPTATTTRRGSFAGDGLAFSAKASSDMSPAGGGVAGNPRYASGPLPAASPAIGGMKPPQFAMWDVPAARRARGDELADVLWARAHH